MEIKTLLDNIKRLCCIWFYKKDEINDLMDEKADTNHSHNNLYYTESEVDEKLNNKSDVNHSHNIVNNKDNGFMSSNDKVKLDSISENADTVTFIRTLNSGTKIGSIKINETSTDIFCNNDTNTTYDIVTSSDDGLMSSEDKNKLDSIANGANKTTVDSSLSTTSVNPVQNKVINEALSSKSDCNHTHDDRYFTESEVTSKLNSKANSSHTHSISNITDLQTTLNGKANSSHNHDDRYYTESEMDTKLDTKADTTVATTSDNGLMSSTMVSKLNGIATGANKTTVDSAMSSTSTNPVQNKVVKAQLDSLNNSINGKANSNHTHNNVSGLKQITNDYVGLPVWYMIKNGWCILQWENPVQYLKQNGINPTLNQWFKLGNVPLPQTGRAVYQQLTTGNSHVRIQVTGGGVLQVYVNSNNDWTYGTMVYPTTATS